MPYKFNTTRFSIWVIVNSLFWALSWLAFMDGVKGAEYVLTLITVVFAVLSLSAWNSASRAEIQKSGGPSVPLIAELLHDLFFIIFFAWCGAFLLAIAMAVMAVNTQVAYLDAPDTEGDEVVG